MNQSIAAEPDRQPSAYSPVIMEEGEEPLRVGIIGGGRGGHSLLEVLSRVTVVRVEGICDVNSAAPGLALAQHLGIPTYPDLAELIANHSFDWLFNVSHASITQRHLLSRQLEGVTVVDGANAELIWKVLVATQSHRDAAHGTGCGPDLSSACLTPLAWTMVHHIVISQQQLQQELTGIAFRDPLTGLYTRRVLTDYLGRQLQSAQRHGHTLSAVLADLDHFKSINDTFGHAAGDQVLRLFGDVLRSTARSSDLVARVGGEEFAVILPFVAEDKALVFAERLRQRVESEVERPDGTPLTLSIGLTTLSPERPEGSAFDASTFLSRADHALYRAKNGGRNRVEVFDGE